MSLINKMLQDLDARGPHDGSAPQVALRPAPAQRAPRPVWAYVALGGLLVAVLVLVALFAWPRWRARAPALPTPPVVPNTVVFATSAQPAAPSTVETNQTIHQTADTLAPDTAAPSAPPAQATPVRQAKPVAEAGAAAPVVADQAAAVKPQPRPLRSAAAVPRPVEPLRSLPAPAGRDMTAAQRAENEYRRALDDLQEGRASEAYKRLEQTLSFDPRHQGARETLIRLLLENNQQEQAMHHMALGLALDLQQPALAMMLARLQVEQGGPAVDTLMRTLPYARNNGEYQAFLAAVLQRAQRHSEAVEHYQQAVGITPQNGVWWLGLGISLQAEQKGAEARLAFERAKGADNLTPQLHTFVERQLQVLSKP